MPKDYQIPDSAYKFYGTGIFENISPGLDEINSFLESIKTYYQPKVTPIHISCRYFGYCDEVPEEKIEFLIPALKTVYKKYLPLDCYASGLYGSWEKKLIAGRHLLMLEVRSEKLKELHLELMAATKAFGDFMAVQGKNFRPHISVGHLREEFKQVPPEIIEFVNNAELPECKFTFTKCYIYTPKGYREI